MSGGWIRYPERRNERRPAAVRDTVPLGTDKLGALFLETSLFTHRVLIVIDGTQDHAAADRAISALPPLLRRHHGAEVLVMRSTTQGASQPQTELDGSGTQSATTMRVPASLNAAQRWKIALEYGIRTEHSILVMIPSACLDHAGGATELLLPLFRRRADFAVAHCASSGGGDRTTMIVNRLLDLPLRSLAPAACAMILEPLRAIPFRDNSEDARFCLELITQFRLRRHIVISVPLSASQSRLTSTVPKPVVTHTRDTPTRRAALATALRCRLHHMGFLFQPRFDNGLSPYRYRTDEHSVHQQVLAMVPPGARVLDLGCGGGFVAKALRARGCHVVGVDAFDSSNARANTSEFHLADLNRLEQAVPRLAAQRFDCVLMLDVIEHLNSPEQLLRTLRSMIRPDCQVVLSTANVAYWSMRMSLGMGRFNYGKRGILDVTHTRLFTVSALKSVCDAMGFDVGHCFGVPPPVTDVVGGAVGGAMLTLHAWLSRAWPSLFGFQLVVTLAPRPTAATLLQSCAVERVARDVGREYRPARRSNINAATIKAQIDAAVHSAEAQKDPTQGATSTTR